MKIQRISEETKQVTFDDGKTITLKDFKEKMTEFFTNKIAGVTLTPGSMERFMRRTSGKSLEQLMKTKKMDGFMEGASDKLQLSKGQKIALVTIFTVVIMAIIAIYMLRGMGIFSF